MGQYFDNQEDLKSHRILHEVFLLGQHFKFYTDHGVFSKKGLDYASRFLLEHLPLTELGDTVLDVGCGYGPIGIVLAKTAISQVDMIDINRRALHLAKENAKLNQVTNVSIFESNCYQQVMKKYHSIITNPPIRAGKEIVYQILIDAKKYLLDGGHLYFVIRKEQGAKSTIRDMENYYNVTIIAKEKGYFVIKCSF